MKIVLKNGVTIGGKTINEFDFNLEKLTGNDLIEAEKEVMIADNTPLVMDFNRSFLITLAAKSASVPVDALKGLNIQDFSKITNEVQRFLTGSASEKVEIAEKISESH